MPDEMERRFSCDWENCGKLFQTSSALMKHKRKKKHLPASTPEGKLRCPMLSCGKRFSRMIPLCKHLREDHDESGAVIQHETFANLDEFKRWKRQLEKRTVSSFVQHHAPRIATTKKESQLVGPKRYWYYYCHRSGQNSTVRTPLANRIRAMKRQGLCKIAGTCSAFISATENIDTLEVTVEYCQYHTGHSMDISHLRMSHELRMEIAGLLNKGETIAKVLDTVRGKSYSDETKVFDRSQLLRRQDVRNVMRSFNTGCTQKSKDDLSSVSVWIEQLNDLEDHSPVLLYKPHGSENLNLPSLSASDFVLCLQTRAQRLFMVQFGSGNLICLDIMEESNRYGYYLVTLIVVDDYGEGIPVAFMICNHVDEVILCELFRAIKSKLPSSAADFNASHLMTDDNDQYFAAWLSVFGPAERKLAAWYIDRTWHRAIKQHVKNTAEQDEIYQMLFCLQELDEVEFQRSLTAVVEHIKTLSPDFYGYFEPFCHRAQEWAYCYSITVQTNANTYVESYHNQLKTDGNKRKSTRRIDSLIHILLHIARYKVLERLVKADKNGQAKAIAGINARHEIVTNALPALTAGGWLIYSSPASIQTHFVVPALDSCSCELRCQECNCCPHMYMCSCVDFAVHATVCRHVHTVHHLLSASTMTDCLSEGLTVTVPAEDDEDLATVAAAAAAAADETGAVDDDESDSGVMAGNVPSVMTGVTSEVHVPTTSHTSAEHLSSLKLRLQSQCQQVISAGEACDDQEAIVFAMAHIKAAYTTLITRELSGDTLVGNNEDCSADGEFEARQIYAGNSMSKRQKLSHDVMECADASRQVHYSKDGGGQSEYYLYGV